MAGEELTIGGLDKSAAAESENRGTWEARKNALQMMMLDGPEAALAARGKQIGDGAVNARNFGVEVDERTGELEREESSDRALASPHESDED